MALSAAQSSRAFRSTAAARNVAPVPAVRRPVACRAGVFDSIGNFFNEGKAQMAMKQAGEYDVPATNAKMMEYIQNNKVVVFSWTGCPYCKAAKAMLTDMGATFTAVELDEMADGKALRAELTKLTGRTSVPNIFIEGKGCGGMNDGPGINTLNAKGELVPMLKAAGAL